MRKILKFIFITFSFFLFCIEGNSQTIDLKNVSVINEQGHVQLDWDYNGTDTLYIYRDSVEISGNLPIAEIVNLSTTSYIDITAQAHINPRSYQIKENSGIESDLVSTYHLIFSYDSCLQQVDLEWTDSIDASIFINDWTASQFLINIIEDGIPLAKESVSGTTTEYTIENLTNKSNYEIFIEIQWQGQILTSFSNPITFVTDISLSPGYINAVSTVVEGNNTNIKFEIDPSSELDTYKLLQSDSETGDFDTLETYIGSEFELIASHSNSNPETDINFYKLISVNRCGNETTNSDIIHNIVLTADITDFDVSLNWNKLNENLTEKEYEIYRTIDNLPTERLHSIFNNTSYNDNIESFQNYGQFCYFIRAIETGTSVDDFSQSNVACVYLEPKIFIPEAFTPNDDGLNDEFKVVFSFVPKEFDLVVYNRWGNKVFETGDYTEAWNGKVSNGNSAPSGTYIYYLKLKSPNDQVIEKRGSVIVIHP